MMRAAVWVAGHRLRWAALTALVAGVCALAAWEAEPSPGRIVVAALAVSAAVAYPLVWRRTAPPSAEGGTARRLGRFALLVGLSLAAVAGVVVGAAVIVGRIIADDIEPVPVGWMYAGLGIFLAASAALLLWWANAFRRIVLCRASLRPRVFLVAGLLVAGGLLVALDRRSVPGEQDVDRQQAREAGSGLYDVLLVVDPADGAGRRLIVAARSARARGESVFPPAERAPRYDAAYGIAIPATRAGAGPLWRLVEPPTADGLELTDALARLPLREPDRPVPGAYGRLLVDTLDDARVRWRPGARRGVAFVLDRLPGLTTPAGGAASACERLLETGPPVAVSDPFAPVGARAALQAHCAGARGRRRWEEAGRPAAQRPPPSVALHAVSAEPRAPREGTWRVWTAALGGAYQGLPARAAAADALEAARDVHTGAGLAGLSELAEAFRPHLRFDRDERFFPVDVDWLLREGGNHRVCDAPGRRDDCEDVDGHASLVGALDEYIDFEGEARLGRDIATRDAGPGRMYVHAREIGGKLLLGYWWFFRYNSSPWRPDVNCLPGLTIGGLSCHDHEGDWEGVTVVLSPRDPVNPPPMYRVGDVTPEAVHFEAHGRPIRWPWAAVERAGDGATHPVVYVAAGSHASYPAPCLEDECTQRLARSGLGEGGFDGELAWPYNDAARCDNPGPDARRFGIQRCLAALPTTPDGKLGALWNAFPGRWGHASCTAFAKVCSSVEGPASPGRQTRFRQPHTWRAEGRLRDLRRARAGAGNR